ETDRAWAVYGIGDLAPGYFEHSAWFHAPGSAPALLLLYRGLGTPVLFALGEPQAVHPLLNEIGDPPDMYLQIRPEILPLVAERYRSTQEASMWRMLLNPGKFQPVFAVGAARLGPNDLAAVENLHADGDAVGERPDFFAPAMLADGTYFGVWEDGELIA